MTERRTLDTEFKANDWYVSHVNLYTLGIYIEKPERKGECIGLEAALDTIVAALAAKHGVTMDEQRAVLDAKAAKKRKSEGR